MRRSTLLSFLAAALIVVVSLGAVAFTIAKENKNLTLQLKAALVDSSGLADSNKEQVQALEGEISRFKEENLALAARIQRAGHGLVLIEDIDPTIILDLRYATTDNFTGKQVYPRAVALLLPETARKLAAANAELREMGYTIKVWDAYRPAWAERELWHATPEKAYVADPRFPSRHNRGTSVDITLVDADGVEVEMPTPFDEFTLRAGRNDQGMSAEARKNMDLLTQIMVKHGFTTIRNEWWHFDDSDWRSYPTVDVSFELFIN